MTRQGQLWLAGAAALVVCASAAAHANSVSVASCGQLIVVTDNGPGDNNGTADEIEFAFTISDPGAWSATGTVIAVGGGQLPGTLIVTDSLFAREVAPPTCPLEIDVTHNFVTFFTTEYDAELTGEYDQLVHAQIGLADLDVTAYLDANSIGVLDPPLVQNVAPPVEFDESIPPVLPLIHPLSQRLFFRFYLDIEGDAIRLYDSASIRPPPPPVPVFGGWPPAVLLGVAIGAVGLASVRRRRATADR